MKPDIILTTVSAYGNGGPYSDRVGFDGIGQVMSGAVYMTGTEGQPYRAQVPWVDFGTALHCAFGTMAALMARKVTGKGQWVQGALLATAVTFGNALLIEQAVIQANRVPTGNRGQTAAPVDIFRTKDGSILVQVIGQPLFKRWAKLMDEEHWLTDPRFKDDIKRGDNGAIISERMSRWCAGRTTADALEILGTAKIPGRPGAEAAADARRPAHQGDGLLPGDRVPRRAAAGTARQGAGVVVGNAGLDPPSRTKARRAHRQDPRRTRLHAKGNRCAARKAHRLADDWIFRRCRVPRWIGRAREPRRPA